MVTLTLVLLTVIIGVVFLVVATVLGGGVLLIIFGDIFVFLAIVALVVKLIRRARSRKTEQ